MTPTEVMTSMWQGAELILTTGPWDTPMGFTLNLVGGAMVDIPTETMAELNGKSFIKVSGEYVGPRKKRYALTDTGLVALGKPTTQQMKQVSVFHRAEKP